MPRRLNNDQFDELRAEAKRFAEMRNENDKLSKQANRNGDKRQAKIWLNEKNRCARLVEEANKSAALKIFRLHNANRSIDTIDLHGLYVKEAIEQLTVRIASATRSNLDELTVIVGRGLHSQGRPKLGPAVIKYANTNGIPYRLESPNLGCIRLELDEAQEDWTSESSSDDSQYDTALQLLPIPVPTARPSMNYNQTYRPIISNDVSSTRTRVTRTDYKPVVNRPLPNTTNTPMQSNVELPVLQAYRSKAVPTVQSEARTDYMPVVYKPPSIRNNFTAQSPVSPQTMPVRTQTPDFVSRDHEATPDMTMTMRNFDPESLHVRSKRPSKYKKLAIASTILIVFSVISIGSYYLLKYFGILNV